MPCFLVSGVMDLLFSIVLVYWKLAELDILAHVAHFIMSKPIGVLLGANINFAHVKKQF